MPRGDALARTALTCTALVFAVVASSAWLRLAQGVTGCPAGGCEGFGLADAVRLAHRLAAMGVSVAALLMAWLAWARRPAAIGLRAATVAILVLVVALAALGRASSGTPGAAVVLGNLAGGLALLGACVAVAFAPPAVNDGFARPHHGPTVLAAVFVVVEALAGAGLAIRPGGEESAVRTAHEAIGWLLPIAWAALATRPGTDAFARGACGATAVLLVVLVAIATLAPATGFTAWVHNVLAAAALCAALAAALRPARP